MKQARINARGIGGGRLGMKFQKKNIKHLATALPPWGRVAQSHDRPPRRVLFDCARAGRMGCGWLIKDTNYVYGTLRF